LTSKYVRKLIKEKEGKLDNKTRTNLFKKLTEKLLIKTPESSDKSEEYNRDNQFRIIFFNEISACSEGNLAIGYADMALEELHELNRTWNLKGSKEERIEHPYELYALYNKGLSYLHDHKDADEAIKTLSQIAKVFEIKEFKREYDEIEGIELLYPIYFWLCHVPSKCLIAEAYSDSFSSSNLETSVQEALKVIGNERAKPENILSDGANHEITNIIYNYYKVKLGIQMIFSAIDKRDEQVFNDKTNTDDWLTNFKNILGDNDIAKHKECITSQSIKSQLDAAKALFFLEHARMFKGQDGDSITKSFEICVRHLGDDGDPDWSDFAYTFLECAIFIFKLENDNRNPLNDYKETYKIIFEKINRPEWIARKKDLVENFLDCQKEILEIDRNKNKSNIYLTYQIKLIKNILSEDSERRFKKIWPECEKERLGKRLNRTIKHFHNNDNVLDWWHKTKKKFEEDDMWKHDFEEIIKDMQVTLSKDIYELPEDVSPVAEFIKEYMNCDYYTKKLRLNAEQFYDHLIYRSSRPSLKDCYGLTVLRRWQSFTPALSMGSEVGHKGGGYFVYKTNHKGEIDEGLVIDPGFDFLENFFEEGFSIVDIKAILITHGHRDHASDFMSIVTLVHEMNKCGARVFNQNKWKDKKLILFITEGCHQNFAVQIMRNRETFQDVIRVQQRPEPDVKNRFKHFKLEVTKANHQDQSDHDSVGYIIKDKSNPPRDLIGFTGDTQWFNGIEDKYKDCPIICMNIGGVVDIFKKGKITLSDLCNKKDEEHINNVKTILLRENHLYLPGFYLMAIKLSKEKQKLLILAELCEEMKGGLRTDLAEKMYSDLGIPVLPEDIGLTVILNKNKKDRVFCKVCQSAHPPKNIMPVETDKDNAIVYLCKDHYRQMREGYSIPKINELELDLNELRKPIEQKNRP